MGARVLIVEDEPELLRAIRVRLTASGFECATAGNGQEALAAVQSRRPDLIIADMLMPVMDGYELCRRLKADEQTAAIPVIALTAIPQHTIDRRADPLEAARVLHKPFESSHLVAVVRELLQPAGS